MGILLNKHRDLPMRPRYFPPDGNGRDVGLRENLANNLKRILRAKKVTQSELAEKIGLTQGSVSGWVTMRDWPSPENIDKVLHYLDITPAQLLGDDPGELALPKPEDELFQAIKMAMKKQKLKVTKSD